jgi:MFS family permease
MIHPAPTSIPDDDLVAIAVRKAGRRLVPFLLLLYILAFLDRVNVSYAKEMLGRDAGLSEATYALGAGVFFIAYALLELPSSLLLQRYGARIWIGRIMITWGLVSALTMFARTATSFCSLRFLLGAAEAGFFPGIIYYLTLWFPRRERTKVFGLFYFGAPLAQIAGGPISGLLLDLDGAAGLKGWQWLFLVEGVMASLAGLWALRRLTDGPAGANWLAQDERRALAATLQDEGHGTSEGTGWGRLLSAVRTPSVFRFGLIYVFIQASVYGVTFYLPSDVARLLGRETGFVVGVVSALPWICALAAAYAIPRLADRLGRRAVASGTLALSALGIAVAAVSPPGIELAALCLAVAGFIGAQPVFWTFPADELPALGAGAGIALINSIGAVGSFVAPNLRAAANAAFHSGVAGSLSVAAAALAGSGLLLIYRAKPAHPSFSHPKP